MLRSITPKSRPAGVAAPAPLKFFAVLVGSLVACLGCASCRDAPTAAAEPTPAVHAEPTVSQGAPLSLQLTVEAEQRVGLVVSAVVAEDSTAHRRYAGDLIAPAHGGAAYGRFPSSTATDLQAMSRAQIAADAQVQRALAQRDVARTIHERTIRLFDEDAGSALDRDRAREQLGLAEASLREARAQRELLGPAVASLIDPPALWLRVPVFSGDLAQIDRLAPARVGDLGAADSAATMARPVSAPPSANPLAGTVDLYYVVPNPLVGGEPRFRIGQKLAVSLPARTRAMRLAVPWSAVIHDVHGGEWIYERTAPQQYRRRRVEVAQVDGDRALLGRGPAAGAEIVAVGATELFGVEFGVAH